MSLIALDIPELQSDIPTWIESVMCAGDLRALVAQLDAAKQHRSSSAKHKDSAKREDAALDAVLGEHRDRVLTDGLAALPSEAISSLLRNPSLLLALQELAMTDGGEHWQKQYTSHVGIQAELAASRNKIDELIADKDGPSQTVSLPRHSNSESGSLLRWMVLAAVLLVGLGIWIAISTNRNGQREIAQRPITRPDATNPDSLGGDGESVDGIGWGWASEKGVPEDLSRQEYLTALAVGASSWSKKQPADKAALIKRLSEFRAGCNRLANMDHPSLPPADQTWLVASCHDWLFELDQLLGTGNSIEFIDMKRRADELAREMESALSDRSII